MRNEHSVYVVYRVEDIRSIVYQSANERESEVSFDTMVDSVRNHDLL